MTASCPYCHQAMIQPEPDKGYWKCAPCNVFQELLGYGVAITYVSCIIKGREYTVRMDGKEMITSITRWEHTADGFAIGEPILYAMGLMNVTPSNIVEKIKLFLVFS